MSGNTAPLPSPGLKLRFAALNDVKAITDLIVPLVAHDGFHDYFLPGQDDHPEDFYNFWYRYVRDFVLKPYLAVLVAEMTDETKEIIGIGAWGYDPRAFLGATKGPKPVGVNIAKNSWREMSQRAWYKASDQIADFLHPNQAVDPNTLAEWGQTMAIATEKHWSGQKANHWYCPDAFAIPGHEKAFSELIQWGVRQATIDGIDVYAGCKLDEIDMLKGEGFAQLDTLPCGPVTGVLMELKK